MTMATKDPTMPRHRSRLSSLLPPLFVSFPFPISSPALSSSPLSHADLLAPLASSRILLLCLLLSRSRTLTPPLSPLASPYPSAAAAADLLQLLVVSTSLSAGHLLSRALPSLAKPQPTSSRSARSGNHGHKGSGRRQCKLRMVAAMGDHQWRLERIFLLNLQGRPPGVGIQPTGCLGDATTTMVTYVNNSLW